MIIPKQEKKNLHSTRVYLYVYFLTIPKQEKKKKKNYTVLEFELEYCVNFFFLFLKNVLQLGRLEYYVNGTRVYQTRVPQKNF